MKTLLLLACLLTAFPAQAQSRWVVTYQGTETRSVSNKLVTAKITERTLIQRCATSAGISTTNLALVLHFGGDSVGDTFEVVNVNDPNLFRCEIFRFAFPQSNTNGVGPGLRRYSYVYDSTSDHSRGSAVYTFAETRTKKKTTQSVSGRLHYWLGFWDETQRDPNAVVASGTFKSVRLLE